MKQQELNKTYLLTSDLSLSTTLSLLQCPIERIDRTTPRKSIFVFKRTKKLNELVDAYYRDELRISPQAYFNQLRAIKARLYANEEGQT
jgi:hypothetical protein